MAFTNYIDTSSSFSPSDFRYKFKKGIGRTAFFHFKLIRLPQIFYKSTNNAGTGLGTMLGINSSLINKVQIPSGITTLVKAGETLFSSLSGRGIDDLVFKINKVTLPEKAVGTYKIKTYGPSYEFPREIENSFINISVISSGTYDEHELFSSWVDQIVDFKGDNASHNVAYYDDIITEAQLVIYDEEANPSYLVSLYDVYPINVGQIDYSWADKHNVAEFTITLQYRKMISEKIASSYKPNKTISTVLNIANKF